MLFSSCEEFLYWIKVIANVIARGPVKSRDLCVHQVVRLAMISAIQRTQLNRKRLGSTKDTLVLACGNMSRIDSIEHEASPGSQEVRGFESHRLHPKALTPFSGAGHRIARLIEARRRA